MVKENMTRTIRAIKAKINKLKITEKAILIAQTKGAEFGKKHGSWWKFNNGVISIEYDDYGNNLIIEWNRNTKKDFEVVLTTQLGELAKAVLMKPWIEEINKLFTTVARQDKDKKEKSEIQFQDLTED